MTFCLLDILVTTQRDSSLNALLQETHQLRHRVLAACFGYDFFSARAQRWDFTRPRCTAKQQALLRLQRFGALPALDEGCFVWRLVFHRLFSPVFSMR
jgi:hypothetical protein